VVLPAWESRQGPIVGRINADAIESRFWQVVRAGTPASWEKSMKSERGRNLVSYQRILRTVGAYVDEYAGSQISLIETKDSIALRTAQIGNGTLSTLIEFSFEDLVDRSALLTRRRGRGAMSAAKPRRIHSGHLSLETMYQDLLRALGWELDDTSAYNVLVEEVDGTFFVTYVALNSPNDPVWTKRSAKLGIPELETMLKDSRARRQLPPLQRRRIMTAS
jgi:hypothetical protein